MTSSDHGTISICIVGAGPRGISIVERIAANTSLSAGRTVHIFLYDEFEPGGGRIWSGSQPPYLLMNTLCADATHFTDESVNCEGPIAPGPNLYEWCHLVCSGDVSGVDDSVIAEASRMEPWSHPSRRLLGRYLEWCHRMDLTRLPPAVRVEFRRSQVVDVESHGGGYLVHTADGIDPLVCDSVILATGHSGLISSATEAANGSFASANSLFYGQPANPLDTDLTKVPARQKLIMRGLGMNFFDYVAMLTVGRGGRFHTGANGFEYLPSGHEPLMVVGSRRGVPYRAKGIFGSMTPTFSARYLTDRYLLHLEEREEQVDFKRDVWPRVVKDAALTYYSVLADVEPEEFSGSILQVRDGLDNHEWGDPTLEQILAEAVPRPAKRIDFEQLDRPLLAQEFDSYDSLLDWWRNDLVADYSEAERGGDSALKCASLVIGSGRAAVRRLARYGGIAGRSYARDVESWYRGYAGALASGPPAERIRELIALVDAGLIIPLGPEMLVERSAHHFVASSPALPGMKHLCEGLLEAHLPAVNLARTANPVLTALHRRGMARSFVIADARHGDFVSGALEVGRLPYEVVNSAGQPQRGLFATGVPLESIHWGTQLGPLAKTNSQFLRDSDALARAAVVHGLENSEQRTRIGSASPLGIAADGTAAPTRSYS